MSLNDISGTSHIALSSETDLKNKLNSLSKKDLIALIMSSKDIQIPVNIFSTDIPPLESLVKFLIEKKGMSIKTVAYKLNRNFKTIWTTYNNSKNKNLALEYYDRTIPLSVFSKTNLSILESLVSHLHSEGLTISEISKLLKKDVRTIWTCNSRSIIKKNIEKNNFNGGKKNV